MTRLFPDVVEVVEVAQDVGFGTGAGCGTDDDTAAEAVLFAEFLDDAAQAIALVARVDFAGNADVIDRRHEDEKAAGQRRMRGQACTFGAQGLLGDLDDDLLAFLQELFDFRLRSPVAALAAIAAGALAVAAGLASCSSSSPESSRSNSSMVLTTSET